MRSWIHGFGHALPETVLGNSFLHDELGLERDLDWVASRLGIETRYSVLAPDYILQTRNRDPQQAILHARARGMTPATLGAEAARRALDAAGVAPGEVGWVIAGTDTPFETLPALACRIAESLGIASGPHCDMQAGCSTFALHMHVVARSIPESLPDWILCVQTSTYTVRTDYSPASVDGYIWGDGAAAQVLSCRQRGGVRVEPMVFGAAPDKADEVTIDATGHFRQDGASVREFSIRRTCDMLEEMAAEKDLYADATWIVTHQANRIMQESVLGHLDLPSERHLTNARTQGNTAAAGCPSVISQNVDRLATGDPLLYAVLGAGLSWGGGYMEVE